MTVGNIKENPTKAVIGSLTAILGLIISLSVPFSWKVDQQVYDIQKKADKEIHNDFKTYIRSQQKLNNIITTQMTRMETNQVRILKKIDK